MSIPKLNWGGYLESIQHCLKDEEFSWQTLKELDPIFEILENIENAPDIATIKNLIEWTGINVQNKLDSPLLDALCNNLNTLQKFDDYKLVKQCYYIFDFPENVFYNGNEDACRFILSKGYFYLPDPQYIIYSSKYDLVEIVKILIENKDFHFKFSHDIFKNKHVKIIRYFIEKIRACACVRCKEGILEGFFLETAKHGILEIMKFMVENKVVDIDEIPPYIDDALGAVSFTVAVKNNQLEIVKFLLTLKVKHRFNIYQSIITGEQKKYTELTKLLYSYATESEINSMLSAGAILGILEVVEKLYSSCSDYSREHTLNYSVYYNNISITKFLLEKGVSPMAVTQETLQHAIENNFKENIKLLNQYGANISLPCTIL